MTNKIEQLIEKREKKLPNRKKLIKELGSDEYNLICTQWLWRIEEIINEFIKDLKSLQEEPTYEQWFERWKQVGYKEWWRDRGKDTTEEREVEKCKPPKFNSFLCQMFWHKSATGGAYDEDVRCDRCWTSIFIDRDWYRSD